MYSPNQLREIVKTGLEELSYPTSPSGLYDPIRYMLALGGKRMRPVLVLMGCDLFDGEINKALKPALAIEVFHNFTLLHDDIMDNAPLRRAKATVHEKWNTNIAILSGDTMFVQSCRLMMQAPQPVLTKVMDIFTQTAIEVCEGQQIDMDFEKAGNVSIDDYLKMIRLKTAVLLGASLEIGGLIGGANESDAKHLYDFGVNLGLAFQLQDDILDVYGDAETFGKQVGGDIIADKKTYLLLTALQQAAGKDKEELRSWIQQPVLDGEAKVFAIKGMYEKLNVRAQAEEKMQSLYQEAMTHLDAIPLADDRKKPLKLLAEELMVRVV